MKVLQIVLPMLLLFVHGVLYNTIGEIAAARGVDYLPWIEIPLDARIPVRAGVRAGLPAGLDLPDPADRLERRRTRGRSGASSGACRCRCWC